MEVVRLPRAFRTALFIFLLTIPLIGVEAAIVSRAHWWKLPYGWMALWSGIAALICLPLVYLMLQGRRWVLTVVAWAGFMSFLGSGLIAVGHHSTGLGFFAILKGVFLAGITLWLRREMSRSFFDPKVRWFQSSAKGIPGLTCYLGSGEFRETFRVSSIDEEGAFLFVDRISNSFDQKSLLMEGEKELSFVFRDREFRCQGRLIRLLNRETCGWGGGFQFRGLSPDHRKDLGSFVESLRGEGYVA